MTRRRLESGWTALSQDPFPTLSSAQLLAGCWAATRAEGGDAASCAAKAPVAAEEAGDYRPISESETGADGPPIRSVKLGSELVINSHTKYSCFFIFFFVKEKDKKVF